MKTLGTKLLQLRHQYRLSLEELATNLGVSKTAIGNWETGKSIPSLENTIKICNHYNICIYDFLEDVQDICPIQTKTIQKNNYLTLDRETVETLITNQEKIIKSAKK